MKKTEINDEKFKVKEINETTKNKKNTIWLECTILIILLISMIGCGIYKFLEKNKVVNEISNNIKNINNCIIHIKENGEILETIAYLNNENYVQLEKHIKDNKYTLIKSKKDNKIYYINEANIETLEKDDKKYNEYNDELNKDIFFKENIKNNTLFAMFKNNKILLTTNNKDIMQFNKETKSPEIFKIGNKQYIFDINNKENKFKLNFIEKN